MKTELYAAYRDWREGMLALQEELEWQDEADFAVWDAADPDARDDFNLFLSARALEHVSFTEMKQMEVRYDAEY